jgi:KDO2-lipid IV(A) lauroyltransferase
MSVSRYKRFRHRLELLGASLLGRLPRLLPYRWSVKAGGLLGLLAFDLFRIRRRVTLENIGRALGDTMSSGELVRTGRRAYVNFAKSMVEFVSLPRLGGGKLRRIVRMHGWEHLEGALEEGKGLMAVTGHFGSWELLGAAAVAYGAPVDFVVGEQTNSLVDDYINGLRESAGIGIIPMGISVRKVFGSLKRNRVVAILIDQDARKMGVFVDFFSIPASTFPGAAQFAHRMGCPIVFCRIVRNRDESHDAYFNPAVIPDSAADGESEVMRLTAEITLQLEKAIRENPDQYFWAHRRWKTRPAGDRRGKE